MTDTTGRVSTAEKVVGAGRNLTVQFAAHKQRKAEKAAANPVLAILYGLARKSFGLACAYLSARVWMLADQRTAELRKLDPTASIGHFEHYVAIGLFAFAVLAMFPDLFAVAFTNLKTVVPWGKKE